LSYMADLIAHDQKADRATVTRPFLATVTPLRGMTGCSCDSCERVRVSAEAVCESMHKASPRKRHGVTSGAIATGPKAL
jgi:hypothetical protein